MTVFRVSSIAAGTWKRALIAPKICAATSRQKNGMATTSQLRPTLDARLPGLARVPSQCATASRDFRAAEMKAQSIRAFARSCPAATGLLWRLDSDQDPQDGTDSRSR